MPAATRAGFTPEMQTLFEVAGVPLDVVGMEFAFRYTRPRSTPPAAVGGIITGFIVGDSDTLILVTSVSHMMDPPRVLRYSTTMSQWAFAPTPSTGGMTAEAEGELYVNEMGVLTIYRTA